MSWTEVPKDLGLHDEIWHNAIRPLISVDPRSGLRIAGVAFDRLIRLDLIDRDEKEVSLAMQQWLCYPVLLADRLANCHGILAKEVFDSLNSFEFDSSNGCFPLLKEGVAQLGG